MHNSTLFYIILLVLSLTACQTVGQEKGTPPGYDLSAPQKYFMPEALLEISGITFKDGVRDSIYAQQDETGSVFILKTGEKKYREVRFAKDGDYEDIAEMDGHFFLLRSDGHLYGFPSGNLTADLTPTVREWSNLLGKGEYEGLFARKDTRELYVLCKSCAADKKKESVSIQVLGWTPDSNLIQSRVISLSVDEISSRLEEKMKGGRFQPSALAQHPLTGEWYILSSVNKLLVIVGDDWKVKTVWQLAPSRFRQPEGIAFDNNGNMFISNEGDEVSTGNVLEFAYKLQP